MTETRKHMALLAITCLLIYANSLRNDFIWDDQALIVANSFLPEWRNLPRLFTTNLFAGAGRESSFYRPAQALSFMVDYHIWGSRPFGFHITNMLLHLGNAALLYALLVPVIGRRATLIASLLFVAHPLQTEAITYIAGRADPLALFFILLALIAYRQRWHRSGAHLWALASLGAFCLALLSKEMALIFPALLILYDVALEPPTGSRDLASRVARRYLPYVLVVVLYGGLRHLVPNLYAAPRWAPSLSIGQRILLSVKVFCEYLWLLAVPRNLHMERSVPVPSSFLDVQVLGGASALALMLGLAWWGWRRARSLPLGIGWFILGFLPISNLYPLNAYIAEHWMYLPGIGLFLVAAVGIDALPSYAHRRWAIGLLAVLLAFYGWTAIRRNGDWRDEATFYAVTLRDAPRSWRVQANLGNMYLAKGEFDPSIEAFQSALRMYPFDVVSYIGMGEAYERLGRDQEAIAQFEKALLIRPGATRAHIRLAELYLKMGLKDRAAMHDEATPRARLQGVLRLASVGDRHMQARKYAEAVEAYSQAAELSPSDAELRSKLGLAYAAMGEGERARQEYERALKTNPASLNARHYLGAYFMKRALWEKAAEQFEQVLRLATDHADAHNNLGIAYYQMGKLQEAEAELRKALALRPHSKDIMENLEKVTATQAERSLGRLEQDVKDQPESARAHYELGTAYASRGELENALRELAIAVRLDPRNPLIHYAIGLVHHAKGERDQARRAWERAVQLDPSFDLARRRLGELRTTGGAARGGQ